jgi:chitosanase
MRSGLLALALLLVAAVPAAGAGGLAAPEKKEYAMELVSSAENSSLNWRAQYARATWT